MQTQKFSHIRGGKVLEIILIIVTSAVSAFAIFLIIEENIKFLSAVIILFSIGVFIWLTYKCYKPTFTDIIFSETSIISKTNFEKEKLNIGDIKGIYFLRTPYKGAQIEIYSPNNPLPKDCLILIGNIKSFEGATFFGLLGSSSILHDSFSKGYTTILYRKKLDPILEYYYRKIKEEVH